MKSVLIYGDSNTWGLIPGSDPAAQYPPEIRWTCRLQSMCPDVRFLTDGLCGRTIAHEDAERPGRSGMQTLPLLLERHAPLDAAVIMLGTNDCKAVFALTPQQIARDMRALLSVLQAYVPANRILLIAPPLLSADVWKAEKDPAFSPQSVHTCRALTAEYRQIAQDCGTAFLVAADHVTASPVDDEHLDTDGHRSLAEAVWNKLAEMQILHPYTVRETVDFRTLYAFFHENGLGVQIETAKPDRILKMWRLDDAATGQLIAAVTLEMRGGVYVLGDIAVKKEMRRKGYGAIMLQTVCREARQMGVRTLWVCAKEPDYYLHHGWQETDWDSAPDIAVYCPVCEKHGVVCHPKKMKKTLDEM